MPRKKLIRTPDLPYHITARVNNRESFPGDLEYTWKTLTNELHLQYRLYEISIHSFVLMPNHFHLMITSRKRSIDLVMKEFLGSSTRILNARHGRCGHIFGGRYFWSVIRESSHYAHAIKYVYRNPVKANLCEMVSDYAFSTYAGRLGFRHLPFPIFPPQDHLDRLLPHDAQALDEWLNRPHKIEENDAIRKALKRKEFKLPIARDTRTPVNVEL